MYVYIYVYIYMVCVYIYIHIHTHINFFKAFVNTVCFWLIVLRSRSLLFPSWSMWREGRGRGGWDKTREREILSIQSKDVKKYSHHMRISQNNLSEEFFWYRVESFGLCVSWPLLWSLHGSLCNLNVETFPVISSC